MLLHGQHAPVSMHERTCEFSRVRLASRLQIAMAMQADSSISSWENRTGE